MEAGFQIRSRHAVASCVVARRPGQAATGNVRVAQRSALRLTQEDAWLYVPLW
jgi:hypothetical protein